MTKNGFIELGKLKNTDEIMCDSMYSKKSMELKKRIYRKMISNLWFHPYASITKTNKEKRGWTKRVEEHRIIFEAYINNIEVNKFIAILRNNKNKSKKLKFINPKIYDIHHINKNPKYNRIENLKKLTKKEHQKIHGKINYKNFNQGSPIYSKFKSIKYIGKRKTYDIECKKPFHNFVANNIVVHNSGKTIIIAGIIKKFNIPRTIIIVPTSDIARNTIRELQKLLVMKIGLFGDGKKELKKITVMLYQSMRKIPNLVELGKYCDLVIVDECHLAIDAIEEILKNFHSTWYRYGLTATPISSARKSKWFHLTSQLGEKIITVTDKQAKKRVAPVNAYMFKFYCEPENIDYDLYRENVLLNKERCIFLLKMVR
jgi:type I site-specific restriction endonuclease